jgi:uncharacterized protein
MGRLQETRHSLAREALVQRLTEYGDYTGVHIVVVFDGSGVSVCEETHAGGVQVFYSGGGHSADTVIERLVAKYAADRDITVATSDLLERQTVTTFGATSISANDLQQLLQRTRAEMENELKLRRQQ